MGRSPKLDNLVQKPRVLAGTFLGTFACYALFVQHHGTFKDESEVRVWFGMRSDARCGRDFLTEWGSETTCAVGQCCSSHGWCGHGEEYCSASLGCQKGCWASTENKAGDGQGDDQHNAMPDDDEYADRMHHYRYDDDYGHRRYGRRYGGSGGYHHDDHHDYHHRYDEDSAVDDYHHDHHDYPHHDEPDHMDDDHPDGDSDSDHMDGEHPGGDHADGDHAEPAPHEQ